MTTIETMSSRADALSSLQNLGEKLSLVSPSVVQPMRNAIPGRVDFSLDADWTRTKKCCNEPPQPDRFVSEVYPLSALSVADARGVIAQGGIPSRLDGRDPVTYAR